jgi:outer membrane immunogenic protein
MKCVKRNSVAITRRSRGLCAGFAAFALVVLAQSAAAADLGDMLRGSFTPQSSTSSYASWDGVYFGAQVGVANMDTDFGNEASQWVGYNLRNTTLESAVHPESWALMPSSVTHGRSYGAFLGYNFQWDQLVIGFDAAYNRMSSMTSSSSAGSINRTVQILVPSSTDTVTLDGTASAKLFDYATLRGRAGYAFGQFLPYAMIGVAVGRFNYTTTANLEACGFDFPLSQCGSLTTTTITTSTNGNSTTSISTISTTGASTIATSTTNTTSTNGTTTNTTTTSTPSTNPFKASLSNSKNNAIVGGFVAGLGMDVALLPNVFLRGEWEFVAFAPVSGIRNNLNTARVGIAVKF